jgi:dipeptidyl aminopeptidase/acylaminoacyl peptidase
MPLPVNRLYLSHALSQPVVDPAAGALYYARQADDRRSLIRQSLTTGFAQAVTTEPAPSGGISYGGGLYAVHANTLVYAGRGGRLHGVDLATGREWVLTPAFDGVAAPAISPCGRFVAFLAEHEKHCNVLLVDVGGGHLPVKLSHDPWFAFNPTFAPDGHHLAWFEWDEHVMSWDESRLLVARLPRPTAEWSLPADALPLATRQLAHPRVSHGSPQFSPDGRWLAFTSDHSGWRALYVTPSDAGDLAAAAQRVDLGPGEIGGPDWLPGAFNIRWADDGSALFALRRHQARASLLRVGWPDKTCTEIETGYTWLTDLHVAGSLLAVVGGRATHPDAVITVDTSTGAVTPRATAAVGVYNPQDLIEPSVITFHTVDGAPVTALFYHALSGPGDAHPRPLLVNIHGGPTSERGLTWDAQAQYFATRGWHYVQVNYRGGTGYGRAFQDKLDGQWGVVDVEDARAAAEHLVTAGLADPRRLVITGASAGGFTTLMALTQDPEFWAAGVSLAGIGHHYDVIAGSHRFEVNYSDSLLGRLPEAGPLWKARSPLTHAARVRRPVQLFHGRQDNVVPVQQSIDFAEAVRRQGGVADLVIYEDEGHSFVKEANRRDQVERMERFLDKYVLAQQ